MQKTGKIDPVTGKAEYAHPDGTTSFLDDNEFAQLSGVSSSGSTGDLLSRNYVPKFSTSSAPIPPQNSINQGITPEQEAALRATLAPAPVVAPAAPAAPAPELVGPPLPETRIPSPDTLANSAPPPEPQRQDMMKVEDSQRTSKDIPASLKKAEVDAADKAMRAVDAKMEAETAVSNAVALKAQEEAALSQKFLDEEAIRQSTIQADIDKRQAELDAISADYSNMEIDSNNYWASKSTGDGILAALAIGLGTFAHVASGAQGESPVLRILQSKIDQDIEIQKANIAKAGNNVATQKGLFSDVLKRTGDERLARLKTHEMGMRSALAQFDQQIAKSNNELVLAKYQQERVNIEQALVQNQMAQRDGIVTRAQTVPIPEAKMTIGEETYEKEMAKVLTEWGSGGETTVAGNMALMEDALAQMKEDPDWISGRFIGRMPELLRSKKALDVMQQVRKAAQANLRTTLGSQFTEKEGERIMAFAFDPKLTPEQNIKMLEMDITNLKARKARLDEQNQHFLNNKRSMRGWTGPQLNTYNPFVNLKEDAKK